MKWYVLLQFGCSCQWIECRDKVDAQNEAKRIKATTSGHASSPKISIERIEA